MKTLSQDDVVRWADCWPVAFRKKTRWTARFVTLAEARKWQVFWKDKSGKRPQAHEALRKIRRGWLGKDHHIQSILRHGASEKKPVLMVVKIRGRRTVVDGNHRLMAMIAGRYSGPILVFERK